MKRENDSLFTVMNLFGKRYQVPKIKNATVLYLKQELEKLTNIPVARQQLKMGPKVFDDDSLPLDIQIKNSSSFILSEKKVEPSYVPPTNKPYNQPLSQFAKKPMGSEAAFFPNMLSNFFPNQNGEQPFDPFGMPPNRSTPMQQQPLPRQQNNSSSSNLLTPKNDKQLQSRNFDSFRYGGSIKTNSIDYSEYGANTQAMKGAQQAQQLDFKQKQKKTAEEYFLKLRIEKQKKEEQLKTYVTQEKLDQSRVGVVSDIEIDEQYKNQMVEGLVGKEYKQQQVRKLLELTNNNVQATKIFLQANKKREDEKVGEKKKELELLPLEDSLSLLYEGKMNWILSTIFQNPAFNALVERIARQPEYPPEKMRFLAKKIISQIPQFAHLTEDVYWMIYPIIFGKPPQQLLAEPTFIKKTIIGFVHVRLKKQKRLSNYYESYVNKELLSIFIKIGVEKNLAQRALRAAKNDCCKAVEYILMGGIYHDVDRYDITRDNDTKVIFYYMELIKYMKFSRDIEQFGLLMGFFKETRPRLFRCFISYRDLRYFFEQYVPSNYDYPAHKKRRAEKIDQFKEAMREGKSLSQYYIQAKRRDNMAFIWIQN